jgi:septal ring factor EnvC (AmiA/AmiB activator)
MGKARKRVKKEKDSLEEELMNVKESNSNFIKGFKEVGKQNYEYLCQIEDLEKELIKAKQKNVKLEEMLKLYDDDKKRNKDLEEKLKVFDDVEKKNKAL